MFNKFLGILDKNSKKNILFLFILYFPLNFIEAFSITSIPGFVMLISEPDKVKNFLPNDNVYNFLIEKNIEERVFLGAVAIVFIFLFRALFIIFVNWFDYRTRYKINVQNSKKLYSSYLNKPYIFHVNNSSSSLIQNMNDSIRSTSVIFSYLNIFKDSILLCLIIVAVFIASPSNFLYLFAFIIVPMTFLFFYLKNIIKNIGIIARNYRIFSHKSISQGFLNIKYIKIQNNENEIVDDFVNKNKVSQKQEVKLSIINTLPRVILEFSSLLFVIIFIAINITSYSNFSEIIPLLTLIVLAAVRMIPSFSQISINLSNIKFNLHTIEKINNEILEWKKNKENFVQDNSPKLIKTFKNEIELNQVCFEYEKNKKIINGINFKIKKGEKVALFGKSGSGKTTLSDIILGLLKPTDGEVNCDGIKISKDIYGWRQLLTYVPQNVVLFDDSIKNNICFNLNNSKVNNELYIRSLQISGLDEVIQQFPNKDNTNVGFLASKVSGGQKQRIGIARAIYSNRPIFILDEATNSLDKKSEDEILSRLFKESYTIIFISHNKEKLKMCDKTINLND